jgi:hypothetical protein
VKYEILFQSKPVYSERHYFFIKPGSVWLITGQLMMAPVGHKPAIKPFGSPELPTKSVT